MFMNDNMVFMNPEGIESKVRYLPQDLEDLEKDIYYIDLVTMSLYLYVGEVSGIVSLSCPVGCICKYNGRFIINRRKVDPETFDPYSVRRVIVKNEESDRSNDTVDSIAARYMMKYEHGLNKVKSVEIKTRNSGNVYIPELKPTDDILTRLIKKMIISKQIILNEYKTEETKDYFIDNLRSALNGTTKNTTISKFLDWCNLLGLYWKVEMFDDPEAKSILSPLNERLVVAKDIFLYEDFGMPEKGVYKVPLDDSDDPLKRLIKVAVIRKKVVPGQYKNKGSNPHLFNNMMSGLKRNSKMMLKYFIYWAEILDLAYVITITDGTHTEVADRNYITIDNVNILNESARYVNKDDDDDDED